MRKKIGIAGTGAIGKAVIHALMDGIDGMELIGVSDKTPSQDISTPYLSFDELAKRCDMIIECLPPDIVPELAQKVLKCDKELIMISSCALLIFPEILEWNKASKGRIIIPSGALAGMDGVRALSQMGIKKSRISSTKPPKGFLNAPHIIKNAIDLKMITQKTLLFSGNAIDAAKGFPANVNVAATLSIAGIGSQRTEVEIWADPDSTGNNHEIYVEGEYSNISVKIENTPDPNNPKSSMLAAQSIIATLKSFEAPLVVR